jgi:peptidoglycan hydrolase-like protein with peptidoglycan-binding domain
MKPIDNAKVRITDKETMAVINELVTNSDGQTEVIDLPAPPLEYSLEYSDNKPYSEYNVVIEADGFEPTSLVGVQILPTRKALQNLSLVPQIGKEAVAENITIEAHTLWGQYPPKIPEPEVKPLPSSTGFIVLAAPVIPQYVIVHLGVPTDTSAQNVWILFKDYIKNVASCEIYSTWPVSTLRANILAILSFTLNRVYTEWYRGKGYDFTITNSTAYDHAFSYERNIYNDISVIVDDIFTTYITKPEIRQPLFTQYCDGKRVNCQRGMQQWGSKDLGEQGLSSIDILKRYYGYDIYLEQAAKVEGVPRSYPGAVLKTGSSGEDVRTIQTQLNAISNNYPSIPKLRVDGIYGPKTESSVKTFQQIFNLPATGAVDFATWYQISNIFVAVSKLAELP